VIRVDYEKYLDEQKGWAEKLVEKSDLDNGATDREYALLAIMAINRLLTLSLQPQFEVDDNRRQDLPEFAHDKESRAA